MGGRNERRLVAIESWNTSGSDGRARVRPCLSEKSRFREIQSQTFDKFDHQDGGGGKVLGKKKTSSIKDGAVVSRLKFWVG
jgi:hypothetical protein